MGVRVQFRGGESAGRVLDFGDDVELVTFGRDPDACDVVFPADQTMVSREHFAIRRVLGSYRLVTNRRSALTIGGREAHDDQLLEDVAEMQLGGEAGPRLVIRTSPDSSEHAATDFVRRAASAGTHTRMERVASAVRRNRVATILLVALVAVVGLAAYLAAELADARFESVERARRVQEAELADVGTSVQRLFEAKSAFRDLFLTAERSVYLILRRAPSGAEVAVGTAWAVAPGTLATNAHVAEVFDEAEKAGEALIARCAAGPHDDLVISGIEIHPGYQEFFETMREFQQRDPAAEFDLARDVVPACDVALLRVRPEDADRLGPPLEIADDARLTSLAAGDRLAFVGFPSEALVRGGFDVASPRATMQVGHLTSRTDWFLSGTPDDDAAELIQFNMAVVGGASGSPVFDDEGRVVAVVSAGNFAVAGGVRIGVGGINFGQRANLVRELLGGEAAAHQADRKAVWSAALKTYLARGGERLFNGFKAMFRSLLTQAGAPFDDVREAAVGEGLVDGFGPTNASALPLFEVPGDGWLAIAVVGEPGVDIDLAVAADGSAAGGDNRMDHAPIVTIEVTAGSRIEAFVIAVDLNSPRSRFRYLMLYAPRK